MIVRTLLAALFAGLVAGALITPIQQAKLVPLIVHAETYENGGAPEAHDHAALLGLMSPAHAHSGEHGEATTLVESRWLGTLLANLVLGAGFALVMVAASLLIDVPITARNGAFWGLAGFAVVTLAPALGLPPELPAMPAGDLHARQAWWLMTAVLTAGGLYLLVLKRQGWAIALGLVLLLLPQFVPVPHPADLASPIPPALAAEFAVASLTISALLWVVIGLAAGTALDRSRGPAGLVAA